MLNLKIYFIDIFGVTLLPFALSLSLDSVKNLRLKKMFILINYRNFIYNGNMHLYG